MKKRVNVLLIIGALALGSIFVNATEVTKSAFGSLSVVISYHLKSEGNIVHQEHGVCYKLMVREGMYISRRRSTLFARQTARRRACTRVIKDMSKAYSNKISAQARTICSVKRSFGRHLKNIEDADWIMIDGAKVMAKSMDSSMRYYSYIKPGKGRFRCKNGKVERITAQTPQRSGPPTYRRGGNPTAPPPPPSVNTERSSRH